MRYKITVQDMDIAELGLGKGWIGTAMVICAVLSLVRGWTWAYIFLTSP